jgi:hypothetical protein
MLAFDLAGGPMPRYFFHFVSKEDFIPDYEGVALPNLKAAHQHAMRLVGHTIAALADEDLRLWMIEIADERQCVVLTVLFPLTPPPKGPGPAHPTLPVAHRPSIERRDTARPR